MIKTRCLMCAAMLLAALSTGCTSINRGFYSQPSLEEFDGPNLSKSIMDRVSVHHKIASGTVTAISAQGTISGRVNIFDNNTDQIYKFILKNNSSKILAEALLLNGDIVIRKKKEHNVYRDRLNAWMHTSFGVSIPAKTLVAWVAGRPGDPKGIINLTTNDSERRCFLEKGWLVCFQTPHSLDKNKIARIVQISVPSVNISFEVDKPGPEENAS